MDELAEINLIWGEAQSVARNRKKWKSVVEALCEMMKDYPVTYNNHDMLRSMVMLTLLFF